MINKLLLLFLIKFTYTLNKDQIVTLVANDADLAKSQAIKAVDSVFEAIAKALEDRDVV